MRASHSFAAVALIKQQSARDSLLSESARFVSAHCSIISVFDSHSMFIVHSLFPLQCSVFSWSRFARVQPLCARFGCLPLRVNGPLVRHTPHGTQRIRASTSHTLLLYIEARLAWATRICGLRVYYS